MMDANEGLVALTLLALLSAGCVEDVGPAGIPPPAGNDAGVTNAVIHGADGVIRESAAFPAPPPRFVQLTVSDLATSEPTVAVSGAGSAFYPVWIGLFQVPNVPSDPPPRSLIYRTQDLGATWRDVTPNVAGVPLIPFQADPYIVADHATGRVFNVNNYAGCTYLTWTDDDGVTWDHSPAACGEPLTDHETLFAGPPTVLTPMGYPSVLYLCFNQIAKATCSRSLDGGTTWIPGGPAYRQDDSNVNCGDTMAHGHGAASPKDGTIYLPRGACGKAWVAVSHDSGTTWNLLLVDETLGIDGHEGRVAVDAEGNVYYLFLNRDRLPHLSVSRDQGETWSTPVNVTRPGIQTARYPAIIAGDEGRVAFTYVGTEVAEACAASGDAESEVAWSQYVGLTLDALADIPVFASSSVNDPVDPVGRGACSRVTMGDFVGMDFDPKSGRIWTSLVDSCTADCVPGNALSQRYDGSRSAVGTLVAGAGLVRIP